MTKKLYIDLFAGCGGLSLGLYHSQLWHGLFAIEKSSDAFSTFKHNLIDNIDHFSWPKWLPKTHHDINKVLEKHEEELRGLQGKIDMVVGGPPCQGFSLAGKRVEDDQRNTLVNSYLKMIEFVKPQTILFENVKGFSLGFKKTLKNGKIERSTPMSEVVLKKLFDMGYKDAHGEVIDFSMLGVPQSRKRFIICATLNNTSRDFFNQLNARAADFKESKGLGDVTTLREALSDLYSSNGQYVSEDFPNFQMGKYKKAKSKYQTLMRKNSELKVPDSHRFANHSKLITDRFQEIVKEKLSPKEVRERFGTKKSSTKLLDPQTVAPTLTTLPDDYVHYHEPRILTVREYARIQSFPDWYEFKGKYTTGGPHRKNEVPRYSQIGNAIPPLFGELAGQILGE